MGGNNSLIHKYCHLVIFQRYSSPNVILNSVDKMKITLNQKIEEIFKQVGEFGRYQLFVLILAGTISFIPAIVGYSFAFYAAIPQFR